MSHDTGLDLVTGTFSYSGARITERLPCRRQRARSACSSATSC
jgi:hypothetical protein